MDDARELAVGGCAAGTVVVAGYQEKGRGRVPGRTWISGPWESLLATLVLDSRALSFPIGQMPLRAAVATCFAIEKVSGAELQIKWPNDLMQSGRKLAGILCETCGSSVLVGMGVNCTQRTFPPELSGSVSSILQASGREVGPLVLLPEVLSSMKEIINDGQWREKLLARLASRGAQVSVSHPQAGSFASGIVRDIDEEGRLVLEDSTGGLVTVSQGEIRKD